MSDNERPLPKPSNKPFGRRNNFEHQDEPSSLLADKMAQAAVEGKLDEFLKKEMPDNENARNLAGMMMGMTGMMPGAPSQGVAQPASTPSGTEDANTAEVPDDVRQAIMGADLEGLMGLLRREYQKRNPDSAAEPREEASPIPAASQPGIDKETIDALVSIASDNSLSLDWIMLRAIKVYVQEYLKTGKL